MIKVYIMARLDVVGLGEICVDYVIRVKEFPQPDEKIFMLNSSTFAGGVTANFVVAISRLGGKAGFIGGVGEDSYGSFLIDTLRREGVDISCLKVYGERRTAVNFLLVNDVGEKVIIQDPNLLENVPGEEYIDSRVASYIKDSKVLHTTAIKFEPTLKAVKIARDGGVTVSFDMEKHVVDTYGWDRLVELLRYTDILMPNKLGLRTLTGRGDLLDAARQLLDKGPRLVVVTMGGEGSIAVTTSKVVRVPAFKIKPVDTTGAGDAFNAAFIYAHVIKGLDLEESSIFANAAAAIKCLKMGAQSGLPKLEDVMRFLEERKVKIQI